MNLKQVQLEIFDDNYRIKKNSQPSLDYKESLVKYKFPTQFCIMAACLIITIVLTFVLGVERGKTYNLGDKKTKMTEKNSNIKEKQIVVPTKKVPSKHVLNSTSIVKSDRYSQTPKSPLDNKRFEKSQKNVTINSSKYIIQVASYKKNSSYIKEGVSQLKQKGYSPFIMASGDYVVIYAGGFINKTEAETQLNKLKRIYKDCYIKKI